MDNIKVRKRDDNTLQDWDRGKVLNSVINAGVSPEEAEHLTALIEAWAKRSSQNGEVSSAHIRGTVVEILKLTNMDVATSFQNYAKPQTN